MTLPVPRFAWTRFRRAVAPLLAAGFVTTLAATAVAEMGVVWHLNRVAHVSEHLTTVLGSPHTEGQPPSAIVFDGAHDGLVVETNPLAGLTQFTIELRIRPDSDGQPEQRFFHIQDATGARVLLEIRLTPDKRWALDTYLHQDDKNQLPLLDRSLLHSAGEWHWVALRYDGHRMASYVDGQAELAGDVAFGPMQPTGQTSIGVRLNKVFWFKGGISEARISPTALPVAQLAR